MSTSINKDETIPKEEMVKISEGYLEELRVDLIDAGYNLSIPCSTCVSDYDLFLWQPVASSCIPGEEYNTEVRVYVPKKASEHAKVQCYVRDFVNMLVLTYGDQDDDCIKGDTRYSTTLTLDICSSMSKETFYTFVGMLCDIAYMRDKGFVARCKTGYKFHPYSIGCLDTGTYRAVDMKAAAKLPDVFDN